MQYGLVESYNDIELTCVVAVRDIWQIQPSWLHPCKVCDKGRSVGKIYREYLFQKKLELLRKK